MINNQWHKSSFCGSGGNCVEVGYKISTFCHTGGCVEVGMPAGEVLVRDTKDRSRPALSFSPSAWRAFTEAIKVGEL